MLGLSTSNGNSTDVSFLNYMSFAVVMGVSEVDFVRFLMVVVLCGWV